MNEVEPKPGPEAFAAFRDRVFDEPSLQNRLRGVADRAAFVDLTVETGREFGYRFAAADVVAALQTGHLSWLTHWCPIV